MKHYKLPTVSPRTFTCLVLALALVLAAAPPSPGPRITSIHLGSSNVEVVVDVPEGVERVVLEGCRRGDLRAWMPRVAQRVSAAGPVRFIVPASGLEGLELFRVRAEDDPLPGTFYTGESRFGGELVDNAAVGDPSVLTLAPTSSSGTITTLRAVKESDIWRTRGDRLYFFNASRGLQIIDIANPDLPALRAVFPAPGVGEEMYLLNDSYVLLLIGNRCDAGASSLVVVVDVTGDQPREMARLPFDGTLVESRLVGTALYVASHRWAPRDGSNDVWESSIAVHAFDLSDPAQPVAHPPLALDASGAVVTATDSHLFVATSDPAGPWWAHTLHVFDITDPSGLTQPLTQIPLNGRLQDKFKVHQQGDLVAVVTDGLSATGQVWRTELATYRLPAIAQENLGGWTRLGKVELGERENLFATRFDGNRAYIVTYRQIDPLWVVDFSDPAKPEIKGELQIPGWSTYIHPMGDRLFTAGIDDTDGRRAAAQLFNVADPTRPTLLSKIVLGDNWSYSEATNDEKALGIFPSDGLVLVPFTSEQDGLWKQGVQFIDLGRDKLAARGVLETSEMVPRRTLLRGERVLAIGSRALLTVDASNLDTPALRHTLELGYPVDRVLPVGDWLVEFSGTGVRVSAAARPSVSVTQYEFDDLPILGATVDAGRIHILQGRGAPASWPVFYSVSIATTNEPDHGVLRHVVLDTSELPELRAIGIATNVTSETSLFSANPLRPLPGLLVWSLERGGAARWWDTGWPIVRVWSATVQPWVGIASTAYIVRPSLSPYPLAQARTLLAMDVAQAESPRFLSAISLGTNAVRSSDTFAADGLVFASHALQQAEIVSTNFYVYTNQVWVAVTNLVWRTNIVSTPVIVRETNALSLSTPVEAIKLRWPGAGVGSRFAGGSRYTIGMTGDGSLLGWGDNSSGALGPAQPAMVTEPTRLLLPQQVADVASGAWQSFALDVNGTVWHWGYPAGPLPPSIPGMPTGDYAMPRTVSLSMAASGIAAGQMHAFALTGDGRLWAWGDNAFGQLGLGHTEGVSGPQLVSGTDLIEVAAGAFHSLALNADGHAFSWGRNDYGQLGRTGPVASPQRVESETAFRAITGGLRHSLALARDGAVWAWGHNDFGQLGPRPSDAGARPLPVHDMPSIRRIAAGRVHNLALAENGKVWFVGNDPEAGVPVVARVEPLADVLVIGAGARHSLALDANGSLYVWGANLSVVGGAGQSIQLSLISEGTYVSTRTIYVNHTNVFEEVEIGQRLVTEVVTNAIPIYQHWHRHFLDVVDYRQDPSAPAARDPASLPGLLQGISHDGALLYTVGNQTTNGYERAELSALAYDGIAAHRITTMTLSSNGEQANVRVHPAGTVLVTRSGWFECWRLGENGQFELLGGLESDAWSLTLLDYLAVLRTDAGLELIDFADPTIPAQLPINWDLACIPFDSSRVSGSAATGVWLPAGELGSILLYSGH